MLDSLAQDDFSAGIVREFEGQRIPANGAYDIVNGLLEEDLAVYRRGGSAYKTTTNFDALGMTVENLAGGQRIVMWDDTDVVPVDAAGTGVVTGLGGAIAGGLRIARPAVAGGVMLIPGGSENAVFYAGSRLPEYTPPQLANLGQGSRTVTWGSGPPVPTLLTSADAGSFLRVSSGASLLGYAVIESVDSDTSVTLTQPWSGATATGVDAMPGPTVDFVAGFGLGFVDADYETFVASAGQRLLFGAGKRLAFSNRQDPFVFGSTDYHLLPDGGILLGLWGQGDSALAFTTSGVWRYSNLAYDLTDAFGNVQQVATDEGRQVILWGDAGLAGWRGAPIVPAIDDVYLLSGPPVPISRAIRPLYREYVKAGYSPGLAAVHRSHYLLPILDGTTWVDTLVCRLDGSDSRGGMRPAWTRWDDHAGEARAFAEQIGSTTRQPKLYAAGSLRVNDLTDCFAPAAGNKNEADGATHDLTVISRDFATRRTGMTVWKYLRARYELTDAGTDNPTLTLEYQLGPPSDTWTAISGNAPESDGTDSYEWSPDERAQAIRFRIKSSGPAAKAVLRSLELFYRQSAKR